MTAIGIWQMGQGAFEIITGIGGIALSGGAAFASAGIGIPLAAASATVPDFWLNAQQSVDLWSSPSKKHKISLLIRKKRGCITL